MLNFYLYYIFAFSLYMTDGRNYSEHSYNFIGDILQLLMQMRHTNNRHIIVNSDIHLSTLSVCKAAHPLEIVVFPDSLIFYFLAFDIHIRSIRSTDIPKTIQSSYAKLR